MSDDPSFLERWSRLKRGETTADTPPEKSSAEKSSAEKPSAMPPENPSPKSSGEEEAVDLSKLPSIDSLGLNSDYSMFMRPGVPEDLKMKALRRMWLTDPVLAGPEMLDMYAFDYTGVDGHKPLVRPVVEAVAAIAKDLLDRAQDVTPAKPVDSSPADPPADSRVDKAADEAAPKPPETGRG